MTRKADEMELETLKTAIAEHPGEHPGFFARLLGWRPYSIEPVGGWRRANAFFPDQPAFSL